LQTESNYIYTKANSTITLTDADTIVHAMPFSARR
jgi:hypothetical protein